MKKTILSFLLIGSAGLAIAQQQPATSNPDRNKINNNGNINSNLNNTQPTNPPPGNQPTTNVNADSTVMTEPSYPSTNNSVQSNAVMNSSPNTTYELNVPTTIQASFKTSYPAVTVNSWYQSGDWYVARYVDNGQIKQVSYREDGKVLTAMMSPVRKSFVPDEIVNQAIQKYGANLYAIGSSKGSDGQDMYHVTLIENGQSRTEWMNSDGSTADNHFRKADEATMQVNRESMSVQQENEIVSQDSTVNQPVADSTAKDQPQKTEAEPQQHSNPQDQDREESNSDLNHEGINNASEINASPKRL